MKVRVQYRAGEVDRLLGRRHPFGKRHALDCFVPFQASNIGSAWEEVELTDDVRRGFKPCLICGGA